VKANGYCGSILVVDHDDASRAAAVSVVSRLGCRADAAADAESVLEDGNDDRPLLAIVEVELPGPRSGLELLGALHAAYGEELPVILVSAERTAPLDHVAGLLLGADDYMAKPFDQGELMARVRRSLARSAYANGTWNGTRNGTGSLSPRELEILGLLARGLTQAQIAGELVMSPKTVGTHIQHILSKLGVHSRAQAVVEAYRLSLATPDFSAHALVEDPVG
jgi:DNA-binding NarL/FixJ family response regulator